MSQNSNAVNEDLGKLTTRDIETLLKAAGPNLDNEQYEHFQCIFSNMLQAEESKITPKAYRLDMLLDDFQAFSKKIEHAGLTGDLIGPVTGFESIDKQLCGAFYPGLHVVCGNTGAGKTAWTLQVACQCGYPALFVSCEMSALELTRRIAARVTNTQLQRFKDPAYKMPASVMMAKAQKAVIAASNLVIADATLTFWDRSRITEHVKRLKKTTDSDQVLIVIDSLNSWAAWLDATEYDRLNMALKTLREMALELECPILYTAEQSKTANRENDSGSDLGSSAPAGFRGIEYGAESVIGLRAEMEEYDDPENSKKKRYRPKKDALGITSVWLTFKKNRNGAPGESIKLCFDGELQKFTEA